MSNFIYLSEETYTPKNYSDRVSKEVAYQLKRIADSMEAASKEAT